MPTRAQLKLACERLFRRSGGSTSRSGVFDDLSATLRQAVATSAGFSESELPVVASVSSVDQWVVATTDNVISCDDGVVTKVPLAEIEDVRSLLLEDGNSGRDDTIVLVTGAGRYELRIEPGYPLGGMWNVLRRLQRTWGATAGKQSDER